MKVFKPYDNVKIGKKIRARDFQAGATEEITITDKNTETPIPGSLHRV
jgi:hypothetical protein